MENTGIPLFAFLLEIHSSSPSSATTLAKSAIVATERWLDATGIAYRKFVPFSPALGKLALFRKKGPVSVEICVVPHKSNLVFAEVYLSKDICKNIHPRCLVSGSEYAKFIVAHFQTPQNAEMQAVLGSFVPPWRKKAPVRMCLALKKGGLRVPCKILIKKPAKSAQVCVAPHGMDTEMIPAPKPREGSPVTTNSISSARNGSMDCSHSTQRAPAAQVVDSPVSSPCAGNVNVKICSNMKLRPVDSITLQNASPVTPVANPPPSSHELQVGMCGFIGCEKCDVKLAASGVDREQFRLDTVLDDCAAKCGIENKNVVEVNHARNVVKNPTFGPNDLLSTLFNDDIHKQIVSFLQPPDIASLGCVNRTFATLVKHYVPGLKLQLFPHQRVALDRMRFMERASRPDLTLPMIMPLKELNGGAKIVADLFDGSIYLVWRVPTSTVPRGGLICDEPGLGKTISGLSLVLKTLKQRASPPPGTQTLSAIKLHNGVETEFKYYNDNDVPDSSLNADAGFGRNITRRDRILYSQAMAVPANSDNNSDSYSAELARTLLEEDLRSVSSRLRSNKSNVRVVRPEKRILLSQATLVLAPRQLIQHWQTQINDHTAPGSLRVYIARGIKNIPSAEVMANDYDIILVSFTVLSSMFYSLENHPETEQPLLQVRFLRILFDEGHKIGAGTNFHRACLMLKAERRWIMTGTPTPSTPNSDCKHLQPMLHFLREPTYGLDPETWTSAIQRPYESFQVESLDRLKSLLRRLMIRTNKSSIPSIPKLVTKNVLLEFSNDSALSYNELVRVVARNVMTSDWFDETHAESLLNPKNGVYCRLVLKNLRYACCFGLLYNMQVHQADLVHTLETLYKKSKGGSKDGALKNIRTGDRRVALKNATAQPLPVTKETPKQYLSKLDVPVIDETPVPELSDEQRYEETAVLRPEAQNNAMKYQSLEMTYRGPLKKVAQAFMNGGNCERCDTRVRQPFVTPCCHVVCASCMLLDDKGCPLENCKTRYALDKDNVPEELIELQPSIYTQDWTKNWDATMSNKIEYLKNRLERIDWCYMGIGKRRKQKVIIFSQFTDHLMLVSMELKNAGYAENYAELYPNSKDISAPRNKDKHFDQQLQKFKHNDKCFILLMGALRGAVGLDLSFAHRVILMEPIWDASLEKQVVARAHRMGCTETVQVERLVMRNSIEQDMMRVEYEEEGISKKRKRSGVGKIKVQYELAKRRKLLLGLDTVSADSSNNDEARDNNNNTPLLRAYTNRKLGIMRNTSKYTNNTNTAEKKNRIWDSDDEEMEENNTNFNNISKGSPVTAEVTEKRTLTRESNNNNDSDSDSERAVKRRLSYPAGE